MNKALALAVAGMALGGCDPAGTAPDSGSSDPGTNAPSASAIPPDGRPIEAATADFHLDGNGVRPDLRFGSPRSTVVAAVSETLGATTGNDHVEECGEGAMDFVRFGGLSLAFQQDRLAGWYARSPFLKRTGAGVRIGDPRSALGATAISESTLGQEFETPAGVNGLLDGKGEKIEALWAGSVCIFR